MHLKQVSYLFPAVYYWAFAQQVKWAVGVYQFLLKNQQTLPCRPTPTQKLSKRESKSIITP